MERRKILKAIINGKTKIYYTLGNVIHNGIKHSRHTLEDIRQESSVLKTLG